MSGKISHKAWVVTVDMGYGHQRAAYPLHIMAEGGEVLSANNYKGIPKSDRDMWENSRGFYEFISRFKRVPLIGSKAFEIYDKFQSIPKFYPKRDLSKPNIQLKSMYALFKKNNWGKHLIDKLGKKPLPFITTFFVTAFMAEYFDYPGEIYCLATDADISRAWVALNPKESRINYFAPNLRVAERLGLYGVPKDRIFFTGFPLPEENLGPKLKTVKEDLGKRLIQLDPNKKFISQYGKTLNRHIGAKNLRKKRVRPLSIVFAVGGAGAQRELGGMIMESLQKEITDGKVIIYPIAGVHLAVNKYFRDKAKSLGLGNKLGKGVNVVFNRNKFEYFKEFNQALRKADILWTKPSELSFYCGLGLPIIMAPPIGSQELFNEKWLLTIGAGVKQEDPRYTNEWLEDWIESGWLAEAALQGFLEAPKYGTYNVEKVIFHLRKETREVKTVLQY